MGGGGALPKTPLQIPLNPPDLHIKKDKLNQQIET